MLVHFLTGDSSDRIRSDCYRYLIEKFRRERLHGRDLRESEHRGTGEERLQSAGPDTGMPEEGGRRNGD
ncbi:hypothetical protein GCM10023228_07320 [Brevibacillus fulvus]